MHEKTSLVLVDKRGFFRGAGYRSRTFSGSNPPSANFFLQHCSVVLPQKVRRIFALKMKKTGPVLAVIAIPSRFSLILQYFGLFQPQKQENCLIYPVDKSGNLFGSGRRIRTLTNGVRVRCATITQFRYAQMILYKTFGICQAYFSHFLFLLFFGRRRPPAVESAWYPQALSTSVPCVSTHARRTSDQCFSAASASSFVA